MAAACAESGYASVSIGGVVSAAAVSRKTFYELFESKEECLLAAHDELRSRLFAAIDHTCEQGLDWPVQVRAALRAALGYLASDLAACQLLTITVVAAGRDGARRYHAMIESLAERLRAGAPASPAENRDAEWGAIALIGVMVCKAAIQGDPEAILAFEDDFTPMLVAFPVAEV